MVWRKRRRYRLANIVSYLCAFFGIVFIAGNVIMLREGFVQLYSTAFHERSVLSHSEVAYARDKGRLQKWREMRMHPADQITSLELPASALKAELQLRKLMEDENTLPGLRPSQLSSEISKKLSATSKTPAGGSANSPGINVQTRDIAVVHVTSRDLRRSLYVTSDCFGLVNRTGMSLIGSGWTKAVYRTKYRDEDVALKMVDPSGRDMASCLEGTRNKNWTQFHCYEQSAQKLLKEIVLLRGLHHPHIIQVLAHCVPDSPYIDYHDNLVSMATELGQGVDIIKLLHLSWEDRLRISYGLTKLLFYLAHSPYGSVVLNDFRRQQFVLVGGDLKLTDLDDMGFSETQCLQDKDCQQFHSSVNVTLRTACVRNRCKGLNEKKNIFNAARHFTTFLLPHGAPRNLRPTIDRLVDNYSDASKTSRQLLQDLTVIVETFSSGSYLDRGARDQTKYRVLPGSDLPGLYDYSCRYVMDSAGCTLSVHGQSEAEDLCDGDDLCKGFVLTSDRTWTGRILAHLKSGVGTISKNSKTSVFIKPDA